MQALEDHSRQVAKAHENFHREIYNVKQTHIQNREAMERQIMESKEEAIEMGQKLGLIKDDRKEVLDDFWDFVQIIAKPFQAGIYEVSGDQLMAEIRAASNQILKHKTIQASRDIIFLHRALTGTYSMLRKLGHRCDYEEIRRQYVQNAIEVQHKERLDRGWDVR